jgi:hypothetical protein
MQLLKALRDLSLKQLLPIAPAETTALHAICSKYSGRPQAREAPPERVARIVDIIQRDDISSLDYRDLRLLMSAAGTTEVITHSVLHTTLGEINRRHDARLVNATFKALMATYRDASMRRLLRSFCAEHSGALRSDFRHFALKTGVLESDDKLNQTAAGIIVCEDLHGFCVEHNLSTNILTSQYGVELKLAVTGQTMELRDADAVQRLIDWCLDQEHGTPIGDYYEAILQPFEVDSPLPQISRILLSKTVQKYGDPRLQEWPSLVGHDGGVRRDRCIATVKRWLSIEYLDLFIEIIGATADRQFAARKAFWLKYFEANNIIDITLILSSDADKVARKARRNTDNAEYMQWSMLTGASPNQSVLLMRIRDLIIAEWSHSGAIRFWDVNNPNAPQFHAKSYAGRVLRSKSLNVKVGGILRESIIHHENGQWRNSAAQVIEHYTGLKV